jgi:hypothetical protein
MFNVGQLCVDVKLKGTESFFDDIKYTNTKLSDWERKLQNRNVNTPDSQTQRANCNNKCTSYNSSISFPYKLYTCTERSCWNRRVFKTVTGSSGETQVYAEAGGTADTQAMKF